MEEDERRLLGRKDLEKKKEMKESKHEGNRRERERQLGTGKGNWLGFEGTPEPELWKHVPHQCLEFSVEE